MKNPGLMKKYTIFIILIYIASILIILPAQAAENSEARGNARDIPVIERVGEKDVKGDNITLYGLEDERFNITVESSYTGTDQLVYTVVSTDRFGITTEGKINNTWIGKISFIPNNNDVGIIAFSIRVKEVHSQSQDELDVELVINNKNDPPEFEMIKDIVAYQGKWAVININATDDDGIHTGLAIPESLSFSNNITFAVPGIEEDVNYKFKSPDQISETVWNIKFQLKPDNDMIGKYRLRFQVKDMQNDIDEVMINLTIMNVNDPPGTPEITNPTNSLFFTNSKIVFNGRCDDPDLEVKGSGEVLNYTWETLLNDQERILGYGKEITIPGLEEGNHTVTLTVRDKAGESSETSIDLTIRSLFDLTPADATKSFVDDKLDLLRFSSEDGVKFEAEFSQTYPWVDITKMSSKIDGIDLVITLELQGSVKNSTGNNYYVYVVRDTHTEDEIVLSSSALPSFYSPSSALIYHSFVFEGGKGFQNKIGTEESFRILDNNKLEFRIRITYLETISGMPQNFGLFAIARYSTESGTLEGQYIYTYDAVGTGAVTQEGPTQFPDVEPEESFFHEPIFLAIMGVIILIIISIVVLYFIKVQKEKKDLVAPPSYDFKMVSGFQDQEQYESLYGSSVTQAQVPPPMGPPGMGMPPPGMGMPPQPGGPPRPGPSCPKCGKAIVVGMTKCPHCQNPL